MEHSAGRAHHRAGYRAVGEFIPRLGGAHRRGLPPSHGQRPHLLRGRRPRHVGERGLRHRVRGPDGLHALTPAAHRDRVVRPARRVRGRRQRRGARRRRTGGEVHRRRGDVGQLDARTARESSARPRRTPAAHGRRACRSAPASATAASWPSAATTSAPRSTWRPAWWAPRRRGRSWPHPMSATSWSTGQRFRRIRWCSRVSMPRSRPTTCTCPADR